MSQPEIYRTSIAIASLCMLVLQNTSLVILLKISFRDGASTYDPATVVLMVEFVKLIACAFAVLRQSARNLLAAIAQIPSQKMLFVPSSLYVLQNNLLFFGARRLSPLVYMVCTQMKTLTSAFVARFYLGTKLSGMQHVALVFLVFGVVIVQVSTSSENMLSSKSNAESLYGVTAVLLASLTSGLAGVILEMIFKAGSDSSSLEHSIWSRNVQLSLVSLPFAFVGTLFKGQGTIFEGFDEAVAGVIFLQAIGGIITGYVLKFSSNISKCIAVSISICCCAVYSVATQELNPTPSLFFGVIVVNAGVSMYSFGANAKIPATIGTLMSNSEEDRRV